MIPSELLELLRRRPFVPFVLVSSDGKTYSISHPDMVAPLPSAIMVLRPNPAIPGAYLGMDFVSMFHIVRVEQHETAQGNGTGQS